jgi:hypothetical protein
VCTALYSIACVCETVDLTDLISVLLPVYNAGLAPVLVSPPAKLKCDELFFRVKIRVRVRVRVRVYC